MAEWLRRQPAKLMGFARVGSNPTVVVILLLSSPTDEKSQQVALGSDVH